MSTGQQVEKPAKISAEQAALVRSALESLISSEAFAGSKQCQDFLRLVVERSVEGEVKALSERMIGVELFGRPADYDTLNDGVVRVRAAEVRKRLAQFYKEGEVNRVVRIELPPGSYVPEFHWSSPTGVEEQRLTVTSRPVSPQWQRKATLVTVLVLVIAILGFVIRLQLRPRTASMNAVRLSLGLPEGVTLHRNWHPFEHIALSPDGQTLTLPRLMHLDKALCGSGLWIRP